MKCPHCTIAFIDDHRRTLEVEEYADESYYLIARICPQCKGVIVELSLQSMKAETFTELLDRALTGRAGTAARPFHKWTRVIWPIGGVRNPVPPEVPEEFSTDYVEASRVLGISANASAALSRRALQHILKNKLGVKAKNLHDEIEQVINDPNTPSRISESLDYLRKVGNFAAHPDKNERTGEIVPVTPDEAEWCLEVIEAIFDVYFVSPARDEEMRKAIQAKKT